MERLTEKGGGGNMARQKNGFIGIRVPIPVKEDWETRAKAEDRSLSSWLRRHVKLDEEPSSERPAKRKKSLAN